MNRFNLFYYFYIPNKAQKILHFLRILDTYYKMLYHKNQLNFLLLLKKKISKKILIVIQFHANIFSTFLIFLKSTQQKHLPELKDFFFFFFQDH